MESITLHLIDKLMIDSYDALPVGKYLQILDACQSDGMEDVDKQIAMLAVLSGKTEDELLNLPLAEYTEMSARSKFLMTAPVLEKKAEPSYKVGQWILIPVIDVKKITVAQYIDFQTFAKGKEARVVELLSCLLVPEGMRYNDGYDVLEVQQAIRDHMSVSEAMSVYAFFLLSSRRSMRAILYSLVFATAALKVPLKKKVRMMTRIWTAARALRQNGVG